MLSKSKGVYLLIVIDGMGKNCPWGLHRWRAALCGEKRILTGFFGVEGAWTSKWAILAFWGKFQATGGREQGAAKISQNGLEMGVLG